MVTVYVEGRLSADGQRVELPLTSCAVMLVASYTGPEHFTLAFVDSGSASQNYVSVPRQGIAGPACSFAGADSLPEPLRRVVLPSLLDTQSAMVRSGLCVVIRHIVKVAHQACPASALIDLLGFRQGSLRMCAEVSGWTKLCEVELPASVAKRVYAVKQTQTTETTILPADFMKLEAHYHKPVKVHNDDKRRRQELSQLRADWEDAEKRGELMRGVSVDGEELVMERHYCLPHGWKKVCARKPLPQAAGLEGLSLEEKSSRGVSEGQVGEVMRVLTYQDIRLVHLYSEGVEMTIADLCLFTYLYFLLESLDFDLCGLNDHFPRIMGWMRHMITLPRLGKAAKTSGFDFHQLQKGLSLEASEALGKQKHGFVRPVPEDMAQDEMELSRRCQTKHKALKPEVIEALKKMQDCGLQPQVGSHPRGADVRLDWDTFPACVHPREGKVPAERVERKCQQLENLVTAVRAVAKPGDTIVDFCSGGGHLGIAIAHVLPECKILLVENKEESLAQASSRMAEMKTDNVLLYQCNLDYFVGEFDVGTCLHACGSATDMVLQQCLDRRAAFVICPCCYGGIQRTHLLDYPRSRVYQDKHVTYTEFLTLGHAADQTEFNIALEEQGRQCMNLVDSDRAELAREAGYSVTLTSLQPRTCSPKNNLLIGQRATGPPLAS